jgi:hypothetical protein
VFHELSCIGIFGTKRAYLHLETPKFQEVFLPKTNPIITGKNVLASPGSKTDVFS